MNTLYVPISAGHRPESLPFEPGDADRWVAAGVPRWAGGGFLALVLCAGYLAVLAVIAVSGTDTPSCTDAAPCGTEWASYGAMLLILTAPYCVWRLPRAAAALLPVVGVGGLVTALVDGTAFTAGDQVVMALLTGLMALVWAGVLLRIRSRSRQRDLALWATGGLRALVPSRLPRSRQGLRRVLAGAGFCLVGGLVLLQGVLAERESAERARGAERHIARVLGPDGDSRLRVRMPDGTVRSLPATFPEEFRPGSEAGVLADGDWARLVAQPYDAMGQQMASLLFTVPGLAMITRGTLLHRRLRALRSEPQPVLRVLVSENEEPTVAVRTEGDPERVFLLYDRVRERPALLRGSSGNGIPWNRREAPRQAVLYGELYDGADVVVLTMAGKGKARVYGGTAVRASRARLHGIT
ncbi:hypothetical protein G6045_10585 [Streptomyces sp. YC504]|uniref:Uncharacterized protein n=1 Tax=Streptomyces mesophilus TaxID=1775132 RepID=A0A6G4XG11_9ACTN|nr:hypothetical protein [Streptomyces mesophilus]NGO76112.1 hypothetical protein [Streptomyces mesophilus]